MIWYSRGKINVKLFIGMANQIDEVQVDAGTMNYHIIQILPTNSYVLKRDNNFEHIIEWIEIQSRWSFVVLVVKIWELCMIRMDSCCCIWNANYLSL